MPLDQFLRTQPSATRQRAQLSHGHTVASDVIDLPRLYGVHDRSGVVAELALGDDLHVPIVALRSSASYTTGNHYADTQSPVTPFTSLFNDVKSRLFDELPDDTWFYPGHGDDSTLGKERPNLLEWQARGW